jgi:hypothetical protein
MIAPIKVTNGALHCNEGIVHIPYDTHFWKALSFLEENMCFCFRNNMRTPLEPSDFPHGKM